MTKPKHFPPVGFLRECFRYDPETGRFWWKERPASHFNDPRVHTRWTRYRAGKEAFLTLTSRGYRRAVVTYGFEEIQVLAHRVAWVLMTGAYPEDQVDHVNCKPSDNRWANLRAATQAQNSRNRRKSEKAKAPLKGVSQHCKTKRWKAAIQVEGQPTHLGYFDTPEQAHVAYAAAAAKHFGVFARAA